MTRREIIAKGMIIAGAAVAPVVTAPPAEAIILRDTAGCGINAGSKVNVNLPEYDTPNLRKFFELLHEAQVDMMTQGFVIGLIPITRLE